MQSDYYLVIGILIGGLAVPSLLNAWSESRPPRAAAIMIMISGGLIVLAFQTSAVGYTFDNIPDAFTRVVAKILN